MITDDMRDFLAIERLGFVATVNPDGTPNLSPKGSVRALDERHLVFADIRSPQTVRNLERNDAIEVNVVDVASRAGYRFSGRARIHRDGTAFDDAVAFLRRSGIRNAIHGVVIVNITSADAITSPSYDDGSTRETLRQRWAPYWHDVWHEVREISEVRGEYEMSTDRTRLDVAWIANALATSTYWAAGIPLPVFERSIAGSLCFGVYADRQVGFARVVTDYATFAWLADVFVDPEHRGNGIGTWLAQAAMSHPSLQGLRRWMLATRDAHAIYAKAGFTPLSAPEMMMERRDPDVYKRSRNRE